MIWASVWWRLEYESQGAGLSDGARSMPGPEPLRLLKVRERVSMQAENFFSELYTQLGEGMIQGRYPVFLRIIQEIRNFVATLAVMLFDYWLGGGSHDAV